MKLVVQRVSQASVSIDKKEISRIENGLLVYLGIRENDTKEITLKMAEKVSNLRIFEDELGKINLNLEQVTGSIMVVSQFTLYGDVRKSNRPSFIEAARPEIAKPLYDLFIETLSKKYIVKTGVFQAEMDILSVNQGPVTIIIDTDKTY